MYFLSDFRLNKKDVTFTSVVEDIWSNQHKFEIKHLFLAKYSIHDWWVFSYFFAKWGRWISSASFLNSSEDDLMKPNQELWFSIQLWIRQEVWSTNLSEVNFGRNEKEMGWQVRSSISHLKNQRVHISQIRHLRQHISINTLLNNNQFPPEEQLLHQILVAAPWLEFPPSLPRSSSSVLLHWRQHPRKVCLVLERACCRK